MDDSRLRLVSLFTGIAGLDRGLEEAGLRLVHMCESWEPARRVLAAHYPDVPLAGDVADFTPSSPYEVLAAGFPCTDLSHVGGKAGIFGKYSGLVAHVFRIAEETRPQWIALENVPNLLSLHQGAGMQYITEQLEGLGYKWAYRTVDSRATGVPQRRPRVIILASLDHEPERSLLTGNGELSAIPEGSPSGFYWTEGRNGLGLVSGATPTLKGGSTLGLPSAPAIWFPDGPVGRKFVLPGIEDGEALQGLPRGWTEAAVVPGEPNLRWKLVGNAVTAGIGAWLGRCITELATDAGGPRPEMPHPHVELDRSKRWPPAGWGNSDGAWASQVSRWPFVARPIPLDKVVDVETAPPLSHRATNGFLSRLDESGRAVPANFYSDLEAHQGATRLSLAERARSTTSWASSPGSRRRMQSQRQRDTAPELRLRRALRELEVGGYRLQYRPEQGLRARLDIVFPGAKVAVDVRGCFWHSCSTHGTAPRANAERWAEKLARNVDRDRANEAALTEAGWQVIVVWEHDDVIATAGQIAQAVRQRRAARPWKKNAPAMTDHGAVRHRVQAATR
jgi:DNA (cytosine-5)-methyltransferase 1